MEENEILEDYGKIYFEKNLPDSCETCPFNYDTISCMALTYGDRPEELTHCLDGDEGYKRRFSKCPLKQLAEKDKEIEYLKRKWAITKDCLKRKDEELPHHDKMLRHQICEKIRENSHPYGFGYIIDCEILDQIEKGEIE